MRFSGHIMRFSLPILCSVSILGCAGTRPADLGLKEGRLRPCPTSPNCVNSMGSEDAEHRVEPLRGISLEQLRQVLQGLERVQIVSEQENYLHAEFTSRIMGFVDDVEFVYVPDERLIHVRSASRLGYSDLGANRQRIEALRSQLAGEGQ